MSDEKIDITFYDYGMLPITSVRYCLESDVKRFINRQAAEIEKLKADNVEIFSSVIPYGKQICVLNQQIADLKAEIEIKDAELLVSDGIIKGDGQEITDLKAENERLKDFQGYAQYVGSCIGSNEMPLKYHAWLKLVNEDTKEKLNQQTIQGGK